MATGREMGGGVSTSPNRYGNRYTRFLAVHRPPRTPPRAPRAERSRETRAFGFHGKNEKHVKGRLPTRFNSNTRPKTRYSVLATHTRRSKLRNYSARTHSHRRYVLRLSIVQHLQQPPETPCPCLCSHGRGSTRVHALDAINLAIIILHTPNPCVPRVSRCRSRTLVEE
jgi:hypothetical protein